MVGYGYGYRTFMVGYGYITIITIITIITNNRITILRVVKWLFVQKIGQNLFQKY